MAKVAVLGWYGNGNLGDEAYKTAFPLVFPNADFQFISDVKPKDSYHNIILGGGDVYNEFYIRKISSVIGKKFAMSVNCTDESLVDVSIAMFDKVFFRAYNEACCYGSKTMVFPDFAFMLKANAERGKQLISDQFKHTESEQYNKVIVVIINSFLFVREGLLARDYLTFEKFANDFAQICDNTNASFLFLPFTNGFPHNDRIGNSIVYSKCKFWKKNSMWYKDLSVQEALDVCAASDLVVSSRLHGGIFSVIGGTPFIDLTHHSKTKAFLNSIDRPHWSVNYWKFDSERLDTMIKLMLTDQRESSFLQELTLQCGDRS